VTERGKYIVYEGQDGTGKSTYIKMLQERLTRLGIDAIEFHEPGEADESLDTMPNHIRYLIKNGQIPRVPSTNIALFSASRNELWKRPGGALEALKLGKWVLSARSWKSTLVYQGYGEGEDLASIEATTLAIVGADYITPDFEAILYLNEDERLRRLLGRAGTDSAKDTFEQKASDFQKRVNDGYLEIAKKYQIPLINGSGSQDEVDELLVSHIMNKFQIDLT
jgi:dTMP kinase